LVDHKNTELEIIHISVDSEKSIICDIGNYKNIYWLILNMTRDNVSVLSLNDSSMNYTIYLNESHSTLTVHHIRNNNIYICASFTNGFPVYLGFYSFRKLIEGVKYFFKQIFFLEEMHNYRISTEYGLENSSLSLNCNGFEGLSYFMFTWILNDAIILNDTDDEYFINSSYHSSNILIRKYSEEKKFFDCFGAYQIANNGIFEAVNHLIEVFIILKSIKFN
jgi:hypothetical protein